MGMTSPRTTAMGRQGAPRTWSNAGWGWPVAASAAGCVVVVDVVCAGAAVPAGTALLARLVAELTNLRSCPGPMRLDKASRPSTSCGVQERAVAAGWMHARCRCSTTWRRPTTVRCRSDRPSARPCTTPTDRSVPSCCNGSMRAECGSAPLVRLPVVMPMTGAPGRRRSTQAPGGRRSGGRGPHRHAGGLGSAPAEGPNRARLHQRSAGRARGPKRATGRAARSATPAHRTSRAARNSRGVRRSNRAFAAQGSMRVERLLDAAGDMRRRARAGRGGRYARRGRRPLGCGRRA